MATIENIRSGLIKKILTIKDKNMLEALESLLSTDEKGGDLIVLSDAQKELLEMSELDIKEDRLISQEAMDKRNLEWLDKL
jgi:hypothetical protein